MAIFNCYVSSPEGKQKVGGLMELITKTELNRVLLCVNCIWRITPLNKYLMICPHGILGRSPSLVGFYPKKKGHNFHLRVLTSQTILILSSMSFNRFPRISHYKPPRKLAKILAQDVRAPPPRSLRARRCWERPHPENRAGERGEMHGPIERRDLQL